MQASEWIDFMGELHSLFPDRVNEAQVKIWQSRIASKPYADAKAALNEYFSNPKKASDGPVPSLPAVLRHMRTITADRKSSEPATPELGLFELMRREWIEKAKKENRFIFQQWAEKATIGEIELAYFKNVFLNSARVYGATAQMTRYRYAEWQDAVCRQGGAKREYDPDQWDVAEKRPDAATKDDFLQALEDLKERMGAS